MPWPLRKIFEGIPPEEFVPSSEARRVFFEKQTEEQARQVEEQVKMQ